MESLVSVLIPAYNHENFIQETISSIIKQSYQSIELIIIDDGSKDRTKDKILEWSDRCKQRFVDFRFLSQENQGTSITLNKLISLANGEYIYSISSDDVAKPNAIQRLMEEMQKNEDYILVACDNEFINSDSNRIGRDDNGDEIDYQHAVHKSFSQFLQKKTGINFNSNDFGTYESFLKSNHIPNGFLVKKQALNQVGCYNKEAPLEDYYLHLQLSKIGKYKYVDEILFAYRLHPNNTIKRKMHMRYMGALTILYERGIVYNLQDKKYKELFNSIKIRKKTTLASLYIYLIKIIKNLIY